MVMKCLCDHTKGVVRVNDQHTEEFQFEKGVRQGCLVSPLLFNAIGERIMRHVEERIQEKPGKVIGGRCLWNIRFADNTTIITRSCEEISEMGEALRTISRHMGLNINESKTSAMAVHGRGEVEMEAEKIKMADEFKFLGSYNFLCDRDRRQLHIYRHQVQDRTSKVNHQQHGGCMEV